MKKDETIEDIQLTILQLREQNEKLTKRIANNKKAISYHYKLIRNKRKESISSS